MNMGLLTNLKIRTKLIVGFGITLLPALIITILGLVYLGSITAKVDRLKEVNLVKIDNANEIKQCFATITYMIGHLTTMEDAGQREAVNKEIGETRARYKSALEKLEKAEVTSEGKQLIVKLKDEVVKGKELNNSVIELAMAGKTKEASEKYASLVKAVESYMGAANDVASYQKGRIEYRIQLIEGNLKWAKVFFVLFALLSLGIAIYLSGTISKSIAVPILRSSSHMDLISKGDFSIPVSKGALARRDEMGVVARSIDSLNVNLGKIITRITSSVESLMTESTQLSQSSAKLSQGASDQVDRANQVAAGSTQMNQASEDIARSTNMVAESATQTVKVAKGGQEVVNKAIKEVNVIAETVETALGFVKELGGQSQKIGDIVTVINDIADQTNLLALNAAIEAARAGEHGRGFAVVADEVRKLAERTSSSTSEIGNMIGAIRVGVEKTVQSMDMAKDRVVTGVEFSSQAAVALEEILESIDGLHGGIQQIAAAIEEMSSTTEEIARDITQISTVTKDTFATSSEISQAANDLSSMAHDLRVTVSSLKT
jgi:methyl-accepting chemotaxis protein